MSKDIYQILDTYWDDIKKDEELITTIQARNKRDIADVFIEAMNELIGQDESASKYIDLGSITALEACLSRNELRVEQRRRMQQILEDKGLL